MSGDPTLRDRVAWRLMRVPALRRLRGWWRDRKGRPGFRPGDFE